MSENTNAVSVMIWDLQGQNVNPDAIKKLEKFVEKLVKEEGLAHSVVKR